MFIESHKQLIVWQKAICLVKETYNLTELFPKSELYGLTSQMRRAAVSIPSNIAEGRRRGSKAEFIRFLRIAFGSGAELETQIEIAKMLNQTSKFNYSRIDSLLGEIMRILNRMTNTN
jgi:four helix bundle protein